MKRHLLCAADLTRDDAVLVLDTAEEMARLADRPIKKLPTLRGRTVVNLFFEDSTRTRISGDGDRRGPLQSADVPELDPDHIPAPDRPAAEPHRARHEDNDRDDDDGADDRFPSIAHFHDGSGRE